VNRIMNLLETPAPERPSAQLAESGAGALTFEGVSFAYPGESAREGVVGVGGATRPAVDDVSFAVPAGSTVALVGATGAGKSTLLKLLLRFLDPSSGRILLDGQDVAAHDPASLRRRIGYVAQEPFLTDGTIAENIAYGERTPELEGVRAAAGIAEIRGFIEGLPAGYDTRVGERGTRLSGGQRQRIALARAFYRDPSVLVLDEATSAVDNETEAAIQHSLARAAGERTTVVVAHRLSTVRHADEILVMDEGRIAERGTHLELVARGGLYAALWRLQTGEDREVA